MFRIAVPTVHHYFPAVVRYSCQFLRPQSPSHLLHQNHVIVTCLVVGGKNDVVRANEPKEDSECVDVTRHVVVLIVHLRSHVQGCTNEVVTAHNLLYASSEVGQFTSVVAVQLEGRTEQEQEGSWKVSEPSILIY